MGSSEEIKESVLPKLHLCGYYMRAGLLPQEKRGHTDQVLFTSRLPAIKATRF